MNTKQKAEISEEASSAIYDDLCKYFNPQSISVPLEVYIMIQKYVDLAIIKTNRACIDEYINKVKVTSN